MLSGAPANVVTGHFYRGINAGLRKKAGCRIRSGEHGTHVLYARPVEIKINAGVFRQTLSVFSRKSLIDSGPMIDIDNQHNLFIIVEFTKNSVIPYAITPDWFFCIFE
ncbi:MAG: ArdC family protein [Gammaproteobacteria bacterium]|nr:ArdC family protein [Gammaproteobacteria bacterium]